MKNIFMQLTAEPIICWCWSTICLWPIITPLCIPWLLRMFPPICGTLILRKASKIKKPHTISRLTCSLGAVYCVVACDIAADSAFEPTLLAGKFLAVEVNLRKHQHASGSVRSCSFGWLPSHYSVDKLVALDRGTQVHCCCNLIATKYPWLIKINKWKQQLPCIIGCFCTMLLKLM